MGTAESSGHEEGYQQEPGGAGSAAHPRLTVVGVGASAGGLEALQRFFAGYEAACQEHAEATPEKGARSGPRIAFVVVTHIPPDQESHLPQLLQTATTMPVCQVEGQHALAPGHVYVIPPGKRLVMSDANLDVESFPEPRGQRTPIDDFFRSLAAAQATTSANGDLWSPLAAIVLSGHGTDGAVGVKAIKGQGGLLLVQRPDDATFDTMPRAAIATGLADAILPAPELARKLLAYFANGFRLPQQPEQLGAHELALLERLLAEVRSQTGYDFGHYRHDVLLRRIRRRMQLHGYQTLDGYLGHLRHTVGEVHALFSDLLVGVYTFFADPVAWQVLGQKVIAQLFSQKEKGERIRAWSIGCATGEEAYSLAMLLLEEAGAHAGVGPVRVFASELDEQALRRAREGVYPAVIEADVNPDRLARFFVREGAYYRVRQELRDTLVFSKHSVLHDPPFSHLDLITSRNLLAYLQEPLQRTVLEIFHYALNPGGTLFLGAEGYGAVDLELFEAVDERYPIFRARARSHRGQLPPKLPFPDPTTAPTQGRIASPPRPAPYTDAEEHYRMLLEGTNLPGLLVDEEGRILYLSPTAGRYLRPRGGRVTALLRHLILPELQDAVQRALNQAFYRREAVISNPLAVPLDGGQRAVVIAVQPALEEGAAAVTAPLARVFFLEGQAGQGNEPLAVSDSAAASPDPETEQALARLHQRLKKMTEAYRRSEADRQTLSEEFSVTTEELETSREELQSINEELRAVNAELGQKVDEVSRARDDLENLIAASDVATLFLDRSLQIRRYTPNIRALFNMRPSDRGRPIGDLAHTLAYDTLVADARRVLAELVPQTHEVQAELEGEKVWFLVRLHPYRTEEERIDGVVLTFVEITALKETEARLRKREQELALLNETLEARVQQRTEEVRELASRLTMAEQAERARVAQVLHDDLQQQLYALRIHLSFLQGQVRGAEARAEARQMQEVLEGALEVTRHLSVDLSPPILEGEGLTQAIRWLATQMEEQYRLAVKVQAEPAGDSFTVPSVDRRVLLFQMVRELLFNVVKHAQTPAATVRLRHLTLPDLGRAYQIDVVDEGPGFDLEAVLAIDGRPAVACARCKSA